MVIILGGSSRVGKTYIAKELTNRYNIPYFSLDTLKYSLLINGTLKSDENDDYSIRYEMWPIIVSMIKNLIDKNVDYIFEGCYVPSEWQDSFDINYLNNIKCLFIVMSERYIKEHKDVIIEKSEIVEKRYNDVIDVERLIKCSQDFKDECIKNNVNYYEIDSKYDLDDIINKIGLVIK